LRSLALLLAAPQHRLSPRQEQLLHPLGLVVITASSRWGRGGRLPAERAGDVLLERAEGVLRRREEVRLDLERWSSRARRRRLVRRRSRLRWTTQRGLSMHRRAAAQVGIQCHERLA
jgi:hypothetical protein